MPIDENIVTGKKFRVWDAVLNKWKRISYWTKASDVELNDGATVEAAISDLNTNLSNKQDKLTNPLTQSDVVDNLNSTSTTTPLSANQGHIMSRDIPWYGTSSTAASTIAKTATTSDSKFALTTGAKVSIKFTYNNTASAPTLNVDSTGAKSIKAYGTTAPTSWWQAGDVVTFTYDGTNWIMGATEGQISQINSDLASKVDTSKLSWVQLMYTQPVSDNTRYSIEDISGLNEISITFIMEPATNVFRKATMHLIVSDIIYGDADQYILNMYEKWMGTVYSASVQFYFIDATHLYVQALTFEGWSSAVDYIRIKGR